MSYKVFMVVSIQRLWPHNYKAIRFYSASKEVSVSDSRIYIQGLSAKDCNDKSSQVDLSLVFMNFQLGDAVSQE